MRALLRRPALRLGTGLVVLLAVLVWLAWPALTTWLQGGAAHTVPPAAVSSANWPASPFAAGPPSLPAAQQAAAAAEAEQAVLRVQAALSQGSLQGTVVDGSWGVFRGGQLQPSFTLRQRFDYLLTLRGEVSSGELRHWLAQQARLDIASSASVPEIAAEHLRQVLVLWDNYHALLAHPSAVTATPDLSDAQSLARTLAARQVQRQQLLGPQWATAFYAEEDAALQDFAQRRQLANAQPGAAQAVRPSPQTSALLVPGAAALTPAQQQDLQAQRSAAFGAEATQRLAEEDALRLDWEQRLGAARNQVQALQHAPELSAPQRLAAQESVLAQRFGGSELLRARALLLTGLP